MNIGEPFVRLNRNFFYREIVPSEAGLTISPKLFRDFGWHALSDVEKGHLINIAIKAVDNDGFIITGDPDFLKKICILDEKPNVKIFIELGFLVACNRVENNA